MTGFDLQISGVGSDHSASCATTTTLQVCSVLFEPARGLFNPFLLTIIVVFSRSGGEIKNEILDETG